MIESFYFDLAKSDSTVTSIYSSLNNEPMPVKADDGNSYDVIPWGAENQLPYELREMVEKNSVLSQDKFFNLLTCYGRGLEYIDIATRNEKKPLPTAEPDIRKFFMRNNLKRFFAEQITDLKYYFFSVCVVILSRDRSKIVRLVHKDACNIRFEKADDMGRIKHVLFADWEANDQPKDVEVIPLLDEYDPLGDLLARTGKEKDVLGIFKKAPLSHTKFAFVCRIPTVGCQYYPVPYWSATLRDGWYEIYSLLTKAKKAKLKNGNNIRYHVEINTKFWEDRARQKVISPATPDFIKIIPTRCSGVNLKRCCPPAMNSTTSRSTWWTRRKPATNTTTTWQKPATSSPTPTTFILILPEQHQASRR